MQFNDKEGKEIRARWVGVVRSLVPSWSVEEKLPLEVNWHNPLTSHRSRGRYPEVAWGVVQTRAGASVPSLQVHSVLIHGGLAPWRRGTVGASPGWAGLG